MPTIWCGLLSSDHVEGAGIIGPDGTEEVGVPDQLQGIWMSLCRLIQIFASAISDGRNCAVITEAEIRAAEFKNGEICGGQTTGPK
jgi:hypothetical protein